MYPYGLVGSAPLGYVGEVSEPELIPYGATWIGKAARKQSFRGVPGTDRGRRLVAAAKVARAGDPGNNMVLSVDWRPYSSPSSRWRSTRAWVVVMKLSTGEVLAMVSKPTFDLEQPARGIRRDEWRQLTNDKLEAVNCSIQGQYPPGSTFKIVTAAAALEEGCCQSVHAAFSGALLAEPRVPLLEWRPYWWI